MRLVLAIALLMAASVPASAQGNLEEYRFIHHLDGLQATHRGEVVWGGYHFTLLRPSNRLTVLGAGFGVGREGYLTVPLFDFALRNPPTIDYDAGNSESPFLHYLSFGAQASYGLRTRRGGVIVGFSYSFR